jgi:hypothetical protein
MDRSIFMEEEIWSIKWKIAINFISGNLVISLDAVFPARIHENARADDICLKEDRRILDASVNVALSSEVDDHVGMLFFKELIDAFPVADVELYESEVRVVHYAL